MPSPPKPKSPAAKSALASKTAHAKSTAQPGTGRSGGTAAPDSVAEVMADAAPPMPPSGTRAPQQGLRMKGFVEAVALRSGGKKGEVKPVLEAALAVLGEALARGEAVNLPGFGKSKIVKTKALADGMVLTLKLKRGADKNASPPLAEADD